jgi:DNA primase
VSDLTRTVEGIAEQYLKWWKATSDGRNLYGACPFHQEETEGAFYMSTENGTFICHACGARGSLYTFMMEVGAPKRLRMTVMDQIGPTLVQKSNSREKIEKKDPFKQHMPIEEALLGIFDFCPKDLLEAGFTKDTLKAHEVGFDKEAQRITFPIRSHDGVLMGISGRTVIGENPRYKLYKAEDLKRFADSYKRYDINKKNFLWRSHLVYPEIYKGEDRGQVIVVEGFKAAMWMVQNGFTNTVALMGTYLSFMQQRLLQRLNAEILIFLDNTSVGEEGVYKGGLELRKSNRVRVCEYPSWYEVGEQPDDVTADDLQTIVKEATGFNNWRRRYERTRPRRTRALRA